MTRKDKIYEIRLKKDGLELTSALLWGYRKRIKNVQDALAFFDRPQFMEGLIPPEVRAAFIEQNLNIESDNLDDSCDLEANTGGSIWDIEFREVEVFE